MNVVVVPTCLTADLSKWCHLAVHEVIDCLILDWYVKIQLGELRTLFFFWQECANAVVQIDLYLKGEIPSRLCKDVIV